MLKKFACGAYLARGPAPPTPGLKILMILRGGARKNEEKRRCFQGVSKWSSTSLLGQASAISRGGKRSSTVPKTQIAALIPGQVVRQAKSQPCQSRIIDSVPIVLAQVSSYWMMP